MHGSYAGGSISQRVLTTVQKPLSERSVYLVRLISIWYCNWFMLFMTLDMPDEALAEDDNSEECAILCESGARPGVYGLLVKCCAMSLFERS